MRGVRVDRVISSGLFCWTGLLAGVSFVATPAKFLAPSLSLPQALDVGRVTFHVLALIEWGLLAVFAVLLAASWASNRARRPVAILLLLIGAILAIETFALRPPLDARVGAIIAGETVAPDHLHSVYVVLEALKLLLIASAAIVQGRRNDVA